MDGLFSWWRRQKSVCPSPPPTLLSHKTGGLLNLCADGEWRRPNATQRKPKIGGRGGGPDETDSHGQGTSYKGDHAFL